MILNYNYFIHRYLKDINNILDRRSKNIEECEINIRDIFIIIARATEYHDYPLLLKNVNHFEKNKNYEFEFAKCIIS